MEINGLSTPAPLPQAAPEPPEGEGSGNVKGVIRKLNEGHFEGKGVSNVRLRISHYDDPDLEPVDPADLLPVPEDGPSNAYEKFLAQYQAKVDADAVVPDAGADPVVDAVADPEPDPVVDPVAAPEPDPVVDVVAAPDPVVDPVVAAPEPDPVVDVVAAPDPVVDPVSDGDGGALAAFSELLEEEALEDEPLDIVL